MNNFGLGLVLSFTDNASAGMNNASRTFQNLSATADQVASSIDSAAMNMYAIAQSMMQVGDTMTGVGSSILGVFTTLGKKVIDTGMTMQGFRMTLSALYGEGEAEAKIKEIQDYAATSVFEIEGLMRTVTMMKAVGIEAMDDVTTSSGQTTQKLMDYASDLAAMMPQMKNMYGTGVEAAMGAFKEYIAEGNAMSLKRGASLDILQILGEDKGATIEERTQQVADLIEKLGIAGYTAQLYGTPMQQISNISDVFFNIMSEIANSGVFDSFCSLLSKASSFLMSFTEDEERFNAITSILGDTITTLMAPLHSILDFVIENADAFLDWVQANPVLAKTILIVTAALGALLVAGGTLLKLSGTILMLVVSIQALGGMSTVLSVLGAGFSALISSIIPFIAIAATLYLAWKNNLFGIRDVVTDVFEDIGTLFSLAFDAWNDSTLSYENFEKARELGILPFIESILDIKYHWGFFVEGFQNGFNKVYEVVNNLTGTIKPVSDVVYTLANYVGQFIKKFVDIDNGSTDAWDKVGEVIGTVAGALAVIVPVVSTAVKAFGLVSAAIGFFTSPLGLIVLAIAAVVAAVFALKKAWDENFGGIRDKAQIVFESLMGFYQSYIVPLWNNLKTFVMTVATLVSTLWNTWLKPAFDQIGGFLSRLWDNMLAPLLSRIGSFMGSVVQFVFAVVNVLLMLWNNVLAPIVNWLVATLAPIVQGVIAIVIGVFEWLLTSIGNIVTGILTFFQGILDFLTGVFTLNWDLAWQGVKEIFQGIWDTLTSIVKAVINAVITIINAFISVLYSALATVVNGISGVINGVASVLGYDLNLGIPENPPQIPMLADGGLAQDPTAAVIGEGSDDEAVLPLNDDVFKRLANGINEAPANVSNNTTEQAVEKNEYQITFAAGSVVIKCSDTSDAGLEKLADKLLKIIKRKLELKKMSQRNTNKNSKVFA